MEKNIYTYVSNRADYDPVKTIFICAPSQKVQNYEDAEQFATEHGWKELAEYEKAVLIIPIVSEGWKKESHTLLFDIYQETKNSFLSKNGRSLIGREGKLWCWETLIYVAGYEDGAVFAGNCVIEHPNLFAAAALLGGAPTDYEIGEKDSDHWLVPRVSDDYKRKNKQIPSCIWLIGADQKAQIKAKEYFTNPYQEYKQKNSISLGKMNAVCYYNKKNCAEQFLVTEKIIEDNREITRTIWQEFFNKIIRWKDGPDGTLKMHPDYNTYYRGKSFHQHSVTVGGLDYPFGVHLPDGMTKEEVKDLPVVFTVHGRGEPAWLFCTKNGWDRLSDETKEFIVVVPDSPGNIWKLDRDGIAFEEMIKKLEQIYQINTERVYLTGFSNGGSIAREVGTTYPQLFAAIAPYNAPGSVPGITIPTLIAPKLMESDYELPYWMYIGDRDPVTDSDNVKEQIEKMCKVNHCSKIPAEIRTKENFYTPENGFQQGERFTTEIYSNEKGIAMIGSTVMKNMPHGAITEQSLATWEFMKHFHRPHGSKKVCRMG